MSKEERKLVEQNIVYEDTLLEITPELMKKTIIEQDKEIERLKEENEELKHKLKLINSYVYGCNIDSLGVDKK